MTKRAAQRPSFNLKNWRWWAVIAVILLVAVGLAVYFSSGVSDGSVLGDPTSPLASSPLTSPLSPLPEATDSELQKFTRAYEAALNHYKAGDYSQAIAEFDAAQAINPKDSDVFNARGNVYLAMGDIEKALEDYNKAIELDDKFGSAYYNRGRANAAKGEYEKALEDFTFVISSVPRLAYDARVNKGVVYYRMGNSDLALAELDKAIETDPNQASAYLNKATILNDAENFSEAVDSFNRAIEIDRNLGTAYWGKGWAEYKLGNYQTAIDSTQTAIELIPDRAALHFNLGLAQLAADQIEEAKNAYNAGINMATAEEKENAVDELERLKEEMPARATDIEEIIQTLE
jgi:tetratricopeptide (TPR) repeat protein